MRSIHGPEKPKKERDLKRKVQLSLSKAIETSSCMHIDPPLMLGWVFEKVHELRLCFGEWNDLSQRQPGEQK